MYVLVRDEGKFKFEEEEEEEEEEELSTNHFIV